MAAGESTKMKVASSSVFGSVLACVLCSSSPVSADGFGGEFEAGYVFSGRNDVRIPGDSGTRFSLVDELTTKPAPVFRLRLGYRFLERHLVTVLYAPLSLNATGEVQRDVDFAGKTYLARSPLLAVYRFDSYRLTYRYSFLKSESLDLAAGVTAKIRDAEVSLYGAQTSRKTNTGFVPLLNVHVDWRPGASAFGLLFDADALAAPQGRAEDVLVAGTWRATPDIGLYAGYRMLEGGADNDEVYSFAWLHYAVVGARLSP
jgi:hypothetical protein